MKSSKLIALIRSSQTQVSKAAAGLKKAERNAAALEPVFRSAKARLKDAKLGMKKSKSDWKSSQALLAGERKHFSKLLRKLGRLKHKAAKISAGSAAPKRAQHAAKV